MDEPIYISMEFNYVLTSDGIAFSIERACQKMLDLLEEDDG
jgi:hypothetical protein